MIVALPLSLSLSLPPFLSRLCLKTIVKSYKWKPTMTVLVQPQSFPHSYYFLHAFIPEITKENNRHCNKTFNAHQQSHNSSLHPAYIRYVSYVYLVCYYYYSQRAATSLNFSYTIPTLTIIIIDEVNNNDFVANRYLIYTHTQIPVEKIKCMELETVGIAVSDINGSY